MSAQVLRLDATRTPPGPAPKPAAISRARLDELHALLVLDPVAGASPARTLFVASEAGKARLAGRLGEADREPALRAAACAIVGYDFPFAVSLLLAASAAPDRTARALAIRTAARGAALQGGCLTLAARSLGLEAEPIAHFDGAGLRTEFFAGLSATVVFLCRLEPRPEGEAFQAARPPSFRP